VTPQCHVVLVINGISDAPVIYASSGTHSIIEYTPSFTLPTPGSMPFYSTLPILLMPLAMFMVQDLPLIPKVMKTNNLASYSLTGDSVLSFCHNYQPKA